VGGNEQEITEVKEVYCSRVFFRKVGPNLGPKFFEFYLSQLRSPIKATTSLISPPLEKKSPLPIVGNSLSWYLLKIPYLTNMTINKENGGGRRERKGGAV